MTFEEKIKERMKEYKRRQDLEQGVAKQVIYELEVVLALLQDYVIIGKQGDLHGEKAVEEVIEWMHGKTVVDKQKLGEFEELLETRPKFYLYRCDEKDSFILALKEVDKHFELLEKKFRELKEK